MKKRSFIISVLITALVSSCGGSGEKVSTVMDKSNIQECEGSFSTSLSKFEIIPLETNDDCLIGEIDVIKKRNGRYYIQSARKTLTICTKGRARGECFTSTARLPSCARNAIPTLLSPSRGGSRP